MGGHSQKTAVDPVCGMEVELDSNSQSSLHMGRHYYFCAECCLSVFLKNPDKYSRPKGPVGRFLQHLVRANVKAFGRAGPPCH